MYNYISCLQFGYSWVNLSPVLCTQVPLVVGLQITVILFILSHYNTQALNWWWKWSQYTQYKATQDQSSQRSANVVVCKYFLVLLPLCTLQLSPIIFHFVHDTLHFPFLCIGLLNSKQIPCNTRWTTVYNQYTYVYIGVGVYALVWPCTVWLVDPLE